MQFTSSNIFFSGYPSLCFLCFAVITTNSFALFFVLSRHGDFKLAKGNVLLSYLGEATRVNHSPIYLFPTSLISLVMVCTKLLLKSYNFNFPLP